MAKCVGCGLEVNAGVLEVKTKTNGGIVCDPITGLEVKFPVATPGDPANQFGCGLTGDAVGHLAVDLCPTGGLQCDAAACTPGLSIKRNTDVCNAVQIDANGLYVACNQTLHSISQAKFKAGITAPVPVNTLGLGTFNFEADRDWQICNTGCCDMQAMVIVETGGLAIDMNAGFLGRLSFEQSFDGGVTWGTIFPEHVQWLDNRNPGAGTPRRESFNLWHETFWNVITKGSCFTYTARMHLQVQAGTGTVSNFGANAGIELHYHASPTFCAPCADPKDGPATTPFDATRNMSYVPR